MTTCADLIEATKALLYGGHPQSLNKLADSYDTDDTDLLMTYPLGGIVPGSYLSIGLEVVYVWATDTASKIVTVERAQQGSTAAAMTSGQVLTVNPLFSNFRIFTELNNDLADLSARDLFRATTYEFTFNAGVYGYDIAGFAGTILGGLEARYDPPGPQDDWPMLRNWQIKRDSDTGDFPSGYSVILGQNAYPGRAVRITYATPFTAMTGLADNAVSTVGLPATAVDIPPLGAALRLQSVREGQRNFNESQGDTRRAEEVPPGAQLMGTRGIEAIRTNRIHAEANRLAGFYPKRRRVS